MDILQGLPLACYYTSCYQLTGAGWLHYQDSLHSREQHTSAVLEEGLLLLGGVDSPYTTEMLPGDGGEAWEGWTLDTGRKRHCSVQVTLANRFLSSLSFILSPFYNFHSVSSGTSSPRSAPPLSSSVAAPTPTPWSPRSPT